MAKTRKPSITVRSVADNYAMANERIIEVSGDQGAGALISIAKAADGSLSIQVYRCERCKLVPGGNNNALTA